MQPVSNPSSVPCTSTTSAGCVIWTGVDIPCLNICKGDTVAKFLAEIATKLCNITSAGVDVTSLDFKCLVEENQAAPDSLLAAIQLMIDKQCVAVPGTPGGESPAYTLPSCLYFPDANGVFVTELPAKEYSEYVASQICGLLRQYAEVKAVLNNHELRILQLENQADPTGTVLTITSACVSGTPGEQTPLPVAFQNLESYLCDLKTTLGENTELSDSVSKQCAGLNTAPSLANPGINMSSIAGWTVNPATVAQSLGNMWITLCDIRQKLQNC